MKQKLLALLLAMAMTLSLAACGGQKPQDEVQNTENQEEVTPPTGGKEDAGDDVDGTTDEPQEAPESEGEVSEAQKGDGTTETEEKPVETVKPVEKPADKPAHTENAKPAEKPAEPKPEEKPAAPAADGVDLTTFYEAQGATGEWPAMMPMEGEALDAFYAGLSDISTKQSCVYMAAISAAVGEIALVEVENADDVQAVKDIFQARINYQVGDETNPGGAWYPASIEGWKNNSRIVSNGNFVMLVVNDNADSVVKSFNALFA